MEHTPPPPLLVVLVSVVGVVSAILVWFAAVGNGPSSPIMGAIRAVSMHPLSLLGALHYLAFVLTAAALAWADLARRGARGLTRAAWAATIVLTGVVGAWAYLARRKVV